MKWDFLDNGPTGPELFEQFMGVDADQVLLAIAAFRQVGLGRGTWETALRALAVATGSRNGQLIGFGAAYTVPFNLITDMPAEAVGRFAEIDGGNPRINSRVRIGFQAPELKVLDETDFDTAGDMRRNPDYRELIEAYDFPFVCLTPLVRDGEALIGLSVLRTAAQGNITPVQKAAFAEIAVHAAEAVRMQLALDAYGPDLLAGALEGLGVSAVICRSDGEIRGLTGAAEALLADGAVLRVADGRLTTANKDEADLLAAALSRAAGVTPAPPADILLHDEGGHDATLATITATPASQSPLAPPLALVSVRVAHPARLERMKAAARTQFRLTPTEAEIAIALSRGASPAVVSAALGMSVATARTHIRSCLSKAGVNSAVGLVARISGLAE